MQASSIRASRSFSLIALWLVMLVGALMLSAGVTGSWNVSALQTPPAAEWGGYLSCIVAGLDHRFKAAVSVYGCGFLHEDNPGSAA